MKKNRKERKKHILIFSIVIVWCFLKTIAYIILAYLTIVFLPYLIPEKNSPNSNAVENMPENCKEIYEMYKAVEYDSIEIMTVYMDNGITTIVFKDKTEERAKYSDMCDAREVLCSYIEKIGELKGTEDHYDLEFDSLVSSGFVYFYDITNFVNTKSFPGLRNYNNTRGWWISQVDFETWEEMEQYFSYADGLICCSVKNMDSIYNANPSKWENLKYLNICYHGEDADMYEAELKRLFPDCEITLD